MPTRRAFLKAAGFTLAGTVLAACQGFNGKQYDDRYQIDGKLVVLPKSGILYAVNDFHGRVDDFESFLSEIDFVNRVKKGEDIYLAANGDQSDPKPEFLVSMPDVVIDGDSKLYTLISQVKSDLGEEGHRLIPLSGNHEVWDTKVHDVLEHWRNGSKGKAPDYISPSGSRIPYGIIIELFERVQGLNNGSLSISSEEYMIGMYTDSRPDLNRLITEEFSQHEIALLNDFYSFNFGMRMSSKEYEMIKGMPIALYTQNGINVVHGGIVPDMAVPFDFASPPDDIVRKALWNRPPGLIDPALSNYNVEDIARFLSRMNNSVVSVHGHTPMDYFRSEIVRDGSVVLLCRDRDGYQPGSIIVAPSHGSVPGKETYFEADLSAKYKSAAEAAAGIRHRKREKAYYSIPIMKITNLVY